jgi:hypothetical protein
MYVVVKSMKVYVFKKKKKNKENQQAFLNKKKEAPAAEQRGITHQCTHAH